MTETIPFRGIYYNTQKVSASAVVAPPYDVIPPALREKLYDQSPYNIVRIDFGIEEQGDDEKANKYTRAAWYMNEWLSEEVLVTSKSPAYYVYAMDYATASGGRKTLKGVFGLVKLTELGQGVYPHEATHSKPKHDRLNLMHSTGANTSPIFSIYRGGSVKATIEKVTSAAPYMSARDLDGSVHSLWLVEGAQDVEAIRGGLSGAEIFIADGHHRYETALEYQRQMREANPSANGNQPWDYVLMFLAAADDPGLTVLPTHRAVTLDVDSMMDKLEKYFNVTLLPQGQDVIKAIEGKKRTFGLYDETGRTHILEFKGEYAGDDPEPLRKLDVVILHKMIFGQLLYVGNWAYEMDPAVTMKMVDSEEFDAAFFLNPTSVLNVCDVARQGLRMPPKSTFFYPKIQTGFIMNNLKSF